MMSYSITYKKQMAGLLERAVQFYYTVEQYLAQILGISCHQAPRKLQAEVKLLYRTKVIFKSN